MTQFVSGDVVILPFTYADLTDRKRRPAVVLLDAGDDDILVAKITSKRHESTFDLELRDWKDAGLLAPSFVRVHKLLTAEKTNVIQVTGRLRPFDLERLRILFRTIV